VSACPFGLLLWAAAVGLAGWGTGQANTADDGLKEIMGDGLKGYIASGIAPSPGYGYGVSFYSAAWPLVESTRPVNRRLVGRGSLVAFFCGGGESSWRAETRTRNGIGNRS